MGGKRGEGALKQMLEFLKTKKTFLGGKLIDKK